MRNKITFFVLSTTGTPIRQATASKNLLLLICFLSIVVVSGIIGGLYYCVQDYRKCKIVSSKTMDLEKQKKEFGFTIAYQKNQIRKLANEIDVLKSDMGELRDLEKRIRIFANIEGKNDEGLFGVGGSLPEDLDPNEKIKEDHSSLIREMHNQVGVLNQVAIFQKNGFETLLEGLEEQRNILASTPSIHPTGKGYVTSSFGYRKSPFTGLREFHKGLDISSRTGTSVFASADGVVSFVGTKGLLGVVVVIDHGHGMLSRYGHLNKYTVKAGQNVKRGQVIGKVGNTGRSTGPHVHYEVHLNGIPVNPEYYILN